MANNQSRLSLFSTTTGKIVALTIASVGILGLIIIITLQLSISARERARQNLAQQFESPQEAVKSQVKRVLYKQVSDDGTITYYEILADGTVNVFDENMNLIRSGKQGFGKINDLFKRLNNDLDSFDRSSTGKNMLLIETNKGTIIIYFDDDDEDLNDYIDEIEDIVEDTFTPTPTPQPPLPTLTPGGPTLTPTPWPTHGPPTPTQGIIGPTPTPTPLPDYMTAPPFDCETYKHLGRPVTISNIVCGID